MNPDALMLVCYIKGSTADNDLWLQNTCHDAVLTGHEAGKKGEEEKKEVKKRGGGKE